MYQVRAFNKKFALWFKGLSIQNIREYVSTYKSELVRGFYESEGSIGRRVDGSPRIMITNNDLELLGLVKDFIEDLGIHCFIYPHSNKRAFILEIVGKKQREEVSRHSETLY